MKQISSNNDKKPGAAGALKKLIGKTPLGGMPPEKREKLLVRGIVAAAVLCMAVYAVVTALPEKQPEGTDVPGTESDAAGMPGQDGTAGTIQSGGGSQSPFDRTDMVTSEGEVKDGFDAETSSYWCITPAFQGGGKTASHKIQVPLGWSAQAVRGGIRLKPEGFAEDAENAEAMLFLWSLPDHFADIESTGGYARSDASVSEAWSVEDWYLSEDGYGTEWPVYAIRHDSRYADDGDSLLTGTVTEWIVLLAKPSENGLYFMSAMSDDAFALMSSPRVNSVPALVREIFPPSSEPGRPEGWAQSPSLPDSPEPPIGTEADDAVDDGTGSDGAEDGAGQGDAAGDGTEDTEN